jgi:hypothetical protein
MTDDEKNEILCDAVHGTMKHAYFLAQKEGMTKDNLKALRAAQELGLYDGSLPALPESTDTDND